MAMLTEEQWADLRAEWEASDRQGIEWMSTRHGGKWDVSPEPIRRRRLREGWEKIGPYRPMPPATRDAHASADKVSVRRLAAEAGRGGDAKPFGGAVTEEAPPVVERAVEPVVEAEPPVESEPVAEPVRPSDPGDLRDQLIDLHRREWRVGRQLLHGAISQARIASDGPALKLANEKMRLAKTGLEAMGLLHTGEARAWGLEADALDYSAMTDEQLAKVAEGKLLR